jgi:hypothetical protein
MDDMSLKMAIENLIQKLAVHSTVEQNDLQQQTTDQWNSPLFVERHKNMITASISGTIYGLRNETSNVNVIDTILNPSFRGNEKTDWGKLHEKHAIKLYEEIKKVKVDPCGLFVSLESGFLGASPDGLVGNNGIIEVKCPYNEREGMPIDVVNRSTNKFLYKTTGKIKKGESRIQLIKTCHYYYQVVMQLHVSGRDWCDFIVWTQGPTDPTNVTTPYHHLAGHIIVTRVFREDCLDIWIKLQAKLTVFWYNDLAPEIVDSRFDRSMGYRQPEYRLKAINEKKERAALKNKDVAGSSSNAGKSQRN